ncbi:glycosyltransferase family 25 protein, partial [Halomonas sp. BC1]|uniref:glycosyltransferase family 25 protein n=1 Tax=Halomonas sp. BC1 TaxID=1670448 RepID=UPI001117FCC8
MTALRDFFAKFDVVLCISLVESTERRLHMQALAERYDISNFQFIDAISADSEACRIAYTQGRVVTFPPCFRCGNLSCGKDDCNNTLIPPQVATFLSYEKVWHWLAQSKHQNALIIEDDLAIADKAQERAGQIISQNLLEKTPILSNERAFLLRFGWALCAEHKANSSVTFLPAEKMSNPCHAINKKMAEHLLGNSDKITTTVDIFQHRQACNES